MLLRRIQSKEELGLTDKKAKKTMRDLSKPITEHLIRILSIKDAPELKIYLKNELATFIDVASKIRVRPFSSLPSEALVYRLLFADMFENIITVYVDRMVRELSGDYIVRDSTPEEIAEKIILFHQTLAFFISKALPSQNLLDNLK